MNILTQNQKQELQAKLEQLTQNNVRLNGNVLTFGNRTFNLPVSSNNQEISSTKTTSR